MQDDIDIEQQLQLQPQRQPQRQQLPTAVRTSTSNTKGVSSPTAVAGGGGGGSRAAAVTKEFDLSDIYSDNHTAAATSAVLTDTMAAYRDLSLYKNTEDDSVRRKPPPKLPGLSRTLLSKRQSSNALLLSSSLKANASTTIASSISTTSAVVNTTTTNTNIIIDAESANKGRSYIESSIPTTTLQVQVNTVANASKVTFNLPEISSGYVEGQETLDDKPWVSQRVRSTRPTLEITIPSPTVEGDSRRGQPPPPLTLTPINRAKYMSW